MLQTTICGIPCQVKVNYYYHQEPDYNNDVSASDYYGYTDLDYTLYDRKGYRADWLMKKMSKQDEEKVQEEILCHLHEKSYVY